MRPTFRRPLIPAATAFVLSASLMASAAGRAAAPPAARPKLAVVIVVDQMRGDYVDRFQADWTGGLKRLVTEGAWFRKAAYPYLSTFTCVGHSTVSTGAFPHTHGMVQNAWWDREARRTVTCTDDPSKPDVTYGDRTRAADSPARLMVPAFADEMRQQRGAHVVSVSLKARSTITLAGHGDAVVTWLGETLKEGWMTSSAYTASPVGAVKAFIDASPLTADYGKTWTKRLPDARYTETDNGEAEAPPRGWTSLFPHELKSASGQADDEFLQQWERSPFADAYLGRLAAALVESENLGHHDGTDLLTVSFSSTDLVGHSFGPDSQEVHDMYAQLDQTIGTLLDRLDTLVGRGAYVVALTGDHGVTPLPEQLARAGKDGGRLNRAAMVEAVEHELQRRYGPGSYVQQINDNDVYFKEGIYARIEKDPAALASVLSILRNSQGIARAWSSARVRRGVQSNDPLLRAAAFSYFPGRSGDVIIAAKPGWMFSGGGTTHGSATYDDQHVPVLFLGAGIKPGRYERPATPADVTPTLAAICGVKMPKAEGHALTAALAAGRAAAKASAGK